MFVLAVAGDDGWFGAYRGYVLVVCHHPIMPGPAGTSVAAEHL